MSPTLSLVVCTYNHADSLAAVLRCIAAQDADPATFETVVVNNRCTDNTSAVVAAAQGTVREVSEPVPGQAHARVRGVRASRGGWVAFVDDDNLLDPSWVGAALRFLAARPDCGVFGGIVELAYETPPPPAVAKRAYAYAATVLPGGAQRLTGDDRWSLRGAGLVCRREALQDAGWLDWQVNVGRVGAGTMAGDDTEIVMRIVRAGWEAWYEPACRLRHVIGAGRLTVAHLRALHRGFAAADPVLLGFSRADTWLRWLGEYALLLARRVYWLGRHGWRGWRDADSRLTALLTLDTLLGNLRGLRGAAELAMIHRGPWLGQRKNRKTRKKKDMLRVLHLHSGRDYGGLERMLFCLGAARAECPEMEPVFGLGYRHRLATELSAAGARVEILGPAGWRRPWQALRAVARLRGLLRREHFDAVVCHGSSALAVLGRGVMGLGVPVVLWMHGDTKVRNKNLTEFVAGKTRPQLVICNSAYTAASLPRMFAQPPPHVVLYCPVLRPVAAGVGRDPRERRAALRAELGASAEAVVVILPSRVAEWKGHRVLLKALSHLPTTLEWRCWIIGGPHDEEQRAFLQSLVEQTKALGIQGRVAFGGERSDVPDLLAAADIFCQPNLTPEPFGINVVEALFAGVPVVASDSGGTREIVDATCGRLVAPGDAAALAAELTRLVQDETCRRALGANGPARAETVSSSARLLPVLHRHLACLSPREATAALSVLETSSPLREKEAVS